jgi:hypothetical protein
VKVSAKFTQPDLVDVTVTATLPLKDWKQIKTAVGGLHGSNCYDFWIALSKVVNEAEKTMDGEGLS